MTDQTEREALADLLVRTDGERDSISAAVDRILAAGFHRTPAPHVESNGPEHGHTFEVSVRSRGASTVIGSGIYRDANWWGDPLVMKVRAWSLPDALAMASQIPFGEWKWPTEDTTAPHVVTTVEEPDYAKYARVILDTGGAVEIGGVRISRLNDNDPPFPDTPEPPADGYVSRNVYDYDEPGPSADVREALVEAIEDDTSVGMSTESIVRRAIEGVSRG